MSGGMGGTMMTRYTGSFFFRAWLLPDDPAEIQTWSHELDPMNSQSRPVSEWAEDTLRDQDLYELLDLDRSKAWQVIGKGTITGWFTIFDEWDESVDLELHSKAEIPEEYLNEAFGLYLGESGDDSRET